ncbi:DNA/RNA non-specific endonuclease [Muricoccus nepalensis]|uniref:DNA/RNA non-specific endonuclease n=1 Tax=Muricoccus nepalensis TaxID=1854500 RepID=UPI0013876407|nr:DNA/RNA non-specific endonuclease [Roseomonas nepalensis]
MSSSTPGHRATGLSRPSLRAIGLALLLGLLLASPPAVAAPSACPEHFANGSAPGILRPALAARVRELCFEGYAVLHSGVSRTPLAVAEHLTRARMAGAREVGRDGTFHEEERLPYDERAQLADYARSGFDRGHMAPSGDMATPTSMVESFSLANMVPQHPASNRCIWEGIESAVRRFAADEGEVYVVTGPVFAGESLERIGGRVLVPTSLYKAVYAPRRGAAAAYLAPNGPGLAWQAVSLAELRGITGIEVFPGVPVAARDRLLSLPAPRSSRARGACEGQAETAEPGGRARDGGAKPERPSPTREAEAEGWSVTTRVAAGLVVVVMIALLVRVLGRR